MMRVAKIVAVSCAAVVLSACLSETGRDDVEMGRQGTTGFDPYGASSSSTTTYGPGFPDVAYGEDDSVIPDVPYGLDEDEDPTIYCQIVGQQQADLSYPPFKTPSGFWDQNGWKACGYIALINANIVSGANDVGGAFEASIRACLAGKGIHDADIANGLTKAEMRKIAKCKEKVMSMTGLSVDIDELRFRGLFSTNLKNRCAKIRGALDAGGSAIVTLAGDGPGGHAMRVTAIECDEPETGDVTLTLADPNYPASASFEVVVDCEDEVTSVSPAHFFLAPGVRLDGGMVETPDG